MKENYVLTTVIIVVVILISATSIFFFSMEKNKSKVNTSDTKSVGDIIQEPIETPEQKEVPVEEEKQTNKEIIMPETATKLKISSGTISYEVKKTYVGKPVIDVPAKTDILEGMGWIDLESKMGYVNAQLDFLNIKSDSPKRDQDIKPLFKETLIKVEGIFEGLEDMKIGKEFQLKAPLKLTINGVEKEVVFNIKAKVNRDMSLTTSGNADIFMSDFGVKAPNVANMFSVDDQIKVTFDIKAEKTTDKE